LGDWLPDNRHVLFAGSEPGLKVRLFLQDTNGGEAALIGGTGLPSQRGISTIGRARSLAKISTSAVNNFSVNCFSRT
jgi:hypothetical protein